MKSLRYNGMQSCTVARGWRKILLLKTEPHVRSAQKSWGLVFFAGWGVHSVCAILSEHSSPLLWEDQGGQRPMSQPLPSQPGSPWLGC